MSDAAPCAHGERIPIDGGGLLLFADAFRSDSAQLMDALHADTHWTRHRLRLFGKHIDAPRLSAWYAEPGCNYRYSGLSLEPEPLGATLCAVRQRIETLVNHAFNSVLLNLYRDGRDSMGWHSDDEPELGSAPQIASLSLGATRRFSLRRRGQTHTAISLDLADGSLLLMEAPLQQYWQHCIPKTRRQTSPRINLTWRQILPRYDPFASLTQTGQ